jgi:hypothetical protein
MELLDDKQLELVRSKGLLALYPNRWCLGILAASHIESADRLSQYHARITEDLKRLLSKASAASSKHEPPLVVVSGTCAWIEPLVRAVARMYRVDTVMLVLDDQQRGGRMIGVPDVLAALAHSSSLLLTYGVSDPHMDAVYDAREDVDVLDRSIPVVEREFQEVYKEHDPYANYWSDVATKMRVQREAYRGLRVNQIIDTRPPKLP